MAEIGSPKLPRHIAIIMDGNGRWAQARNLSRTDGHKAGAESVRRMVELCAEFKIPYLTLFAFSTENWQRPQSEIDALMRLLEKFLKERAKDLHKHKIRLNAIGQIGRLPVGPRTLLERVMADTQEYENGVLTLALSYGSREEIVAATRKIAEQVRDGSLTPELVTEETVANALYTADLPDPDLLIRTSGEMRLSNFLLWQISYAEIVVTPCLWPDFGREQFVAALDEYASRRRRFGGI